MGDLTSNLVGIGVSGLLSVITFLFAAWIKGQMKERILELEIKLAQDYVRRESLDAQLTELKNLILALQTQVLALQRVIDRRVGARREEDQED